MAHPLNGTSHQQGGALSILTGGAAGRFRHLVPRELKIRSVLRGALLGVHLPGIARGRCFARPVLIPSATASQTVARELERSVPGVGSLSATVPTTSRLVHPGVFGAHLRACDTLGGETPHLQSREWMVREGWLQLGLSSQRPAACSR